MPLPLDLHEAQSLILKQVKTTPPETVPLTMAFRRIPCASFTAQSPGPTFNLSLRDGYVITRHDLEKLREQQHLRLKITGELAAGCPDMLPLSRGGAIHIMTGAPIPKGGCQVLPLEHCRTDGDFITVSTLPPPTHTYIKKKGADFRKNKLLLKAGQPLEAEHLALLAETGNAEISVFQQPRIAILSTGSELTYPARLPLQHGQVFNSNRFLLDGLIRQAGGLPFGLDTAADDVDQLCDRLRRSLSSAVQMVISTGGMGPGKYDLVPEAVEKLGGRILYRALNIRPGKATLLAIIDTVLFFSLPGSPPAVRLLFSELVRPAILMAQGCSRTLPDVHKAALSETVRLGQKGMLQLKGGRLTVRQQGLTVRPARQTEPINCIMVLPPHRQNFKSGEKLTVHTDNLSIR